jgi:cytochrome c553
MPAWEAQARDDEVWDVVAFLLALPRLTPEQGAAMSRADVSDEVVKATQGRLIAIAGPPQKAEAACVRCHGYDGAGHASGAFPRLNGLDAAYLEKALRDYRSGARPSGFMAPVARALTDDEMRLVAQHYASMPAAAAAAPPDDPALLQKGAALAATGAPGRGIAACISCHGTGKAPALDGQYRDYVARQLELWKGGHRRGDADDVMGRIARAMTAEEIRAVAVYYAALPGRALAE